MGFGLSSELLLPLIAVVVVVGTDADVIDVGV